MNASLGRNDYGRLNKSVLATMKRDINNATPALFMEAGVPSNTFSKIYKLIESELLPPAMALRNHETTYDKEMESYTGVQMAVALESSRLVQYSSSKWYMEALSSLVHSQIMRRRSSRWSRKELSYNAM